MDYVVIISGENGITPNSCFIYLQNTNGDFTEEKKYSVFFNSDPNTLLKINEVINVLKNNKVSN